LAALREDVALPGLPRAVEDALRDHWHHARVLRGKHARQRAVRPAVPAVFAPLPGAFFHPFQNGPGNRTSLPDLVRVCHVQ
jgi:hypothetical protein